MRHPKITEYTTHPFNISGLKEFWYNTVNIKM